jgi:hypothetical protein
MSYGLDACVSFLAVQDFASPQSPIQWVLGALSPRVKQQGCEAGHSSPSSAEVFPSWWPGFKPSSGWICGGQSGSGAGFLLVLRFPLPIIYYPKGSHLTMF